MNPRTKNKKYTATSTSFKKVYSGGMSELLADLKRICDIIERNGFITMTEVDLELPECFANYGWSEIDNVYIFKYSGADKSNAAMSINFRRKPDNVNYIPDLINTPLSRDGQLMKILRSAGIYTVSDLIGTYETEPLYLLSLKGIGPKRNKAIVEFIDSRK